MRRYIGFKLGHRLLKFCCPFLRRQKPKHYIRLDSSTSRSPYSQTLPHNQLPKPKKTRTVTKLFNWSHCLKFNANAPLLESKGSSRDACKPPPKGYVVVYVGEESVVLPARRVLVPVLYLNHPLFKELLREVQEEFGFEHRRGITILCSAAKFESVRMRIAVEKYYRKSRRWDDGY